MINDELPSIMRYFRISARSRLAILVVAGTAMAGVAGLAAVQAGPALADPAEVYIAVGSDTTQDVMDQYALDLGSNELGSYDAVNPVTGAIAETITPVAAGNPATTAGPCSFTRPDGSTQGLNALEYSIDPDTSAQQLAAPPQPGCVDIARSSAGPGPLDPTDPLVSIPFALDAVTGATSSATALTTADSFTVADLQNLYQNCATITEGGATYNPGTATAGQVQIDLYVPQPGSGDLTFWANLLGFSASFPPTCVHQTIVAGPSAGQLVEENDGTAVTSDPNGYMPFSVAQWIGQRNSHDDRRHGAVLHDIGGVTPCTAPDGGCTAAGSTLNTAFPVTRQVYNVVQDSRVQPGGPAYDPGLASLLVGSNSSLCQDTFTIISDGFVPISTCGSPRFVGDTTIISVSCAPGATAGNCAAGGVYSETTGKKQRQALAADETSGKGWGNAQQVPNTGTLNAGGLAVVYSMSCSSAGNCAAGGYYSDATSKKQAFVANETGGTWGNATLVPNTDTLNTGGNAAVFSVSCALGATAGNCTAGGYYTDSKNRVQAFVVDESKSNWGMAQQVPGSGDLNTGGSAAVYSVSCASAGNCARRRRLHRFQCRRYYPPAAGVRGR